MKSIVQTEYGSPDVLHLTNVEKPLPKDNEILVKVHATSINFGDTMVRNFRAISPRQFNMPLLKRANIQPGQKVLINGVSGGIDSVAAQIAKSLGLK